MELKQYLIDTFKFNDASNKKVLEKIKELPDKTESVKLFSHLITCQFRWIYGISQNQKSLEMSWWETPFDLNELEAKWNESLKLWIDYLNSKTDDELNEEVKFLGWKEGDFAAKPKDIALQLNYHSIHHRAQIQTLIRQQGLKPASVDYINSNYRNL